MKSLPGFKFLHAFLLLAGVFSCAQAQPLTFLRMYDSGNSGFAVRQVNGNSYVVAGGTDYYYNFHWDLMSPKGTTNIHFFKTDLNGALLWEKKYFTLNSRTIARWFEPTNDGGYILTGHYNTENSWSPDSNSIVLIKTDAWGNIAWSKLFDTGKDELGFCVQQTFDGGFIISGFLDSVPTSLAGNTCALLIKTDVNRNLQWTKKYQLAVRDLDSGEAFPFIVKQTADSGYIVVGTTANTHSADVYVIRTNPSGNLVWANSYDHDNTYFRFSTGQDVIESVSGDFIIAGSMDKDQPTMKRNYPYIIKLSSAGALVDARFYESLPFLPFQSGFSSVQQTADGGFFFTGMGGYSNFGDQAQLLKTDVNFNMQWSRVYSWDGIATTGARSGRQTADGGYVFTGKRQFTGTVILKTDNVGLVQCKNPGTLVEIIPGIIVQPKNPAATTGINSFPILLTTVSPLVDTTVLCQNQISTMPVELVYFSAYAIANDNVKVEWKTLSELNNDFFIVERSGDGKEFHETARIKGAGNSSKELSYSFVDENPLTSKVSYYRLKQVDYDGQYSYSPAVPVRLSGEGLELLNVFSDYTHQTATLIVNSEHEGKIPFELGDFTGRVLKKGLIHVTNGINTETIYLPGFSKGIYFLHLSGGEKFIVKKIIY